MQAAGPRFIFLGAALVSALGAGTSASASSGVSFTSDLAPVLQQKCVACHGPEKQKGGYRLDSFDWLLKTGDSGDAPITAGNPDESHLFELVVAEDEDDRMPQKDDPLPASFIESLKRWIAAGAHFDGPNPRQSLADLIPPSDYPMPPEYYPHAIPVLALAFVGNGRQIAIGGYHEVLVRELESGKLQRRFTNLPERIHALLPVNRGTRLLYAGGSPGRAGEAGLMDLDPSAVEPRQVLARSSDTFLAIANSPDGQHLAVGGADKLIRIFERESAREVRQLTQHADWVMGLAYNADGSRLASASRDGTARVFDPVSGEMIAAFREHTGPVFDVAFVGDGSQVASAGRDGRVRFWKSDRAEQTTNLGDLGGELFRLARVGEKLFVTGADGAVFEIGTSERKVGRRWNAPRPAAAALALTIEEGSGGIALGFESGAVAYWREASSESPFLFEAWPRSP